MDCILCWLIQQMGFEPKPRRYRTSDPERYEHTCNGS